MKVDVEKQNDQTAKIQLEIPSDQATQEYNKAWRRLGQRLNIPGFRRGKAPRSMVEKTIGVDRIKQEALDRLLPHAFADAISENQLDIVAPPQIESFKFELSDGIQVSATVELRPEAKVADLDGVALDVPEYKLPADSEESELQSLRERMSTLEPVIDRETVKEDIVNIDFTGYVDGEPIKGGAAKNYRLDLANNNFIEGFAEQLVGHKLGEEFSINVTFPESYHDKTLAGKPAEFKVKVNEINRKVTPELDDELAKKVGDFENLDQLKDEIRNVLSQSEEQENTFRKQKAAVDYLIEKSEVDIPDTMVTREARLLKDEVEQRLKAQGMTWERFVEEQGKDETWDNLKEEAVKRIKTSLVFGALAKQEGLSVSEEEFQEQVKELARMRGVDEKNIMRHLGNNVAAAQALSDQVLSQKIVDFLLERVNFNMVAETEGDKEEKPPAAKGEAVAVASAIEGEEFDVLEEEE